MEEEFEEPLESSNESLEAEFDKIRDARVHEILLRLKSLYVVIIAYKQYIYEEDTDFSSTMRRVNDSLNSEEEREKVFRYFGISDDTGSDNFNNYYNQIVMMVFSPDYKPPDIDQDIYDHLLTLYFHYSSYYLKDNYLLWHLRIDLSLFKAMTRASLAFHDLIRKGKGDLTRTKGSTRTLKTKAQKRREHIIQIFPHIKKMKTGRKMTLRAIALAIQQDWKDFPPEDQDIKKPPGLTLISETLKKSEETKREFE